MSDFINGGHPLILEAQEARDKLALMGGNERLLAKLDDLLTKASGSGLHGGEQAKLRALLSQVAAL